MEGVLGSGGNCEKYMQHASYTTWREETSWEKLDIDGT